jgi:hypothetical protein
MTPEEHRCGATDDAIAGCPACLAAAKAVWTPQGIQVAHSDAHISMNIAHEAALEDDAKLNEARAWTARVIDEAHDEALAENKTLAARLGDTLLAFFGAITAISTILWWLGWLSRWLSR